jgi:AcrR family transcriptional regulator
MTDKQIRIISAAIEIFSQKGYAATTTSAIAKKAGVGEGTIFHHYKSKKDLLMAIPDYLSKSSFSKVFIQDIIKIIDNPYERFEDFLKAIIQNRMNFVSANMTLIKVLFQEIPFHPELRTKFSETVFFPAIAKLTNAIDKFKEQGQVIDIPSISIVKLLFTSIFGYLFMRNIAMFELKWDSEKETDYLVQYIMTGLCNCNK